MSFNATWSFVLALASVVCLGCGGGGPEIATVEGTVTMDGKPLPNAAVLFIPEGGRPAGAKTDANGHYVLNFTQGRQGAIPGRNIVRISTLSDASEDASGNVVPGSPETVPVKYNAQTTLEYNVEAGAENVADFDLKSDGKVVNEPSGY